VGLILGAWVGILIAVFFIEYLNRSRYFRQIFTMMDELEERYLLSEMIPISERREDKLYREILHRSNQAVIEKIAGIQQERKDYQEFIESWIHEIKAPMTDIRLICSNQVNSYAIYEKEASETTGKDEKINNEGEAVEQTVKDNKRDEQTNDENNVVAKTVVGNSKTILSMEEGDEDRLSLTEAKTDRVDNKEMYRKLIAKLSQVENYVDMALYYARSDSVYQDYLIAPVPLQETVIEILQQNKLYFMDHQVAADISFPSEPDPVIVPGDRKWLGFIFNQIFLNAVKYRNGSGVTINISAQVLSQGIDLHIEDKGIGIPAHELPRIFDKGFTGNNGRTNQSLGAAKSTGIGLYLCQKLCAKMAITITVASNVGEYTRITLHFPKSDYYRN
jgi:signal transduction histidine kinase